MYQTEVLGQSLSSGIRFSFAKPTAGPTRYPCKSHDSRNRPEVRQNRRPPRGSILSEAGRTGFFPSCRRTVRPTSRQAGPAVASASVPRNLSSGWLRGGSRSPDTDPSIGPKHRRIPTRSFRPPPLRSMPAAPRQQLPARSKEIIAAPGDGLFWTMRERRFSMPQGRPRDRGPSCSATMDVIRSGGQIGRVRVPERGGSLGRVVGESGLMEVLPSALSEISKQPHWATARTAA